MKWVLKVLVRLSLLFFGVLLLLFLVGKYSWHFSSRKERLEAFAQEVSQAPSVPDSLMAYFYADNPERLNASLTSELFGYGRAVLIGDYRPARNSSADDLLRCYLLTSNDANYRFPGRIILLSVQLGFGLESLLGESKCANYYVMKDFEETCDALKHLPYTWVGKQLSELTEKEFIEYIAVRPAPTYYGKFTEPERFAKRIETVVLRAKKQRQIAN